MAYGPRVVPAGERNQAAHWGRLRRVPSRTRAAALAILGCSACPPALLAGAPWSPLAASAAAHPALVNLAAFAAAVAAVIAWEPPRCVSPGSYARQLRARFAELKSMFDADDRRRPGEGKENEDARVPYEP
jgi:hypothetical protein